MPGVNAPSGDYFTTILQQLRHELNAIAAQQTWYTTDPTGAVRVSGGLLPSGDFGILLIDAANHQQQLLPAVDSYVNMTLTTTSTTAAPITGSPQVIVNIASSGDARVTCGAFIGLNTNEVEGVVYLNGTGPAGTGLVSFANQSIIAVSSSAGGVAINSQSTRSLVSWLTAKGVLTAGQTLNPGTWTFTLTYQALSGIGANFSGNYLQVQPT